MSFSNWVRQVHRWLSIAFTLAVAGNTVVVAQGEYLGWLGFLAALPLALLLLTGLYLFALPHVTRWRSGRPAD
jgi:hypothetical protein